MTIKTYNVFLGRRQTYIFPPRSTTEEISVASAVRLSCHAHISAPVQVHGTAVKTENN